MIRKLSQKPTNTSRTMNVTYSLFSEVKNDPFGKLPRLLDAMPQPSHGSFDEMPRPFTPGYYLAHKAQIRSEERNRRSQGRSILLICRIDVFEVAAPFKSPKNVNYKCREGDLNPHASRQ